MHNDDLDRVVPLDQLDDFRVADGDPDIRGWDVLAADGRKIGEVDELLVDTAAMKVRYLDVDLDDEVLEAGDGGERHVLIPIGYARLDRDADRVMVDALRADDLRRLPAYGHGPLTRAFEASVRESFTPRTGAGPDDLPPATRDATSAGDPSLARDAGAMGTSPGFGAASGTAGGGAGLRADAPTSSPSGGVESTRSGTAGAPGGGFLRDETTSVGDPGRTGTTGGMTGAGFGGASVQGGLRDHDDAGPGHTRGAARNADDFYAGREFDDDAFWSSRRRRDDGL
jgi:hypothetical protein